MFVYIDNETHLDAFSRCIKDFAACHSVTLPSESAQMPSAIEADAWCALCDNLANENTTSTKVSKKKSTLKSAGARIINLLRVAAFFFGTTNKVRHSSPPFPPSFPQT